MLWPNNAPYAEIATVELLDPTHPRLELITRPEGSQVVSRWFAADIGQVPLRSAEAALELIHKQSRHFAVLQNCGIALPRYSSFIATPRNSAPIAIFHLVEPVRPHGSQVSPERKRQLGKSLLQYVAWVRAEGEPEMLNDIYATCQYVHDGESWTLVDLDPRFSLTYGKPLFGPNAPNVLQQAVAGVMRLCGAPANSRQKPNI